VRWRPNLALSPVLATPQAVLPERPDMPIDPIVAGLDTAVNEYERARPGYPAAAVEHVVDALGLHRGRRVVELGAGTGKLTRELVRSGAEVVAVEPLPGMRDQLQRVLPGVEILDGTAEAIPLADRSVHAAVAAQAFHWFDAPAALEELGRVLVPGGAFAVVHNRRDTTTPVQAAIDDLLAPYYDGIPSWGRHDPPEVLLSSEAFADLQVAEFSHAQRLDAAGLAARVASISFVARMDDRTRNSVLSAVGSVFEMSRRDGVVDLHYVTEVRTVRRVGP
jgi:SAM-dependent methyltransferase